MAASVPLADTDDKGQHSQMLPRVSLLVCLCFLAGCHSTKITYSPWEKSPAGNWLTRIERWDTAGPGIGNLAEVVQVKRVGADTPLDIFTLDENNGAASIKLRWINAGYLEVGYVNGEPIRKVSKTGGLSVRAIPLAASKL